MLDVILWPENININVKHNHNGIKSYKYNNDDNIVIVSACPEGIPIHPSVVLFEKSEHLIKGLFISS